VPFASLEMTFRSGSVIATIVPDTGATAVLINDNMDKFLAAVSGTNVAKTTTTTTATSTVSTSTTVSTAKATTTTTLGVVSVVFDLDYTAVDLSVLEASLRQALADVGVANAADAPINFRDGSPSAIAAITAGADAVAIIGANETEITEAVYDDFSTRGGCTCAGIRCCLLRATTTTTTIRATYAASADDGGGSDGGLIAIIIIILVLCLVGVGATVYVKFTHHTGGADLYETEPNEVTVDIAGGNSRGGLQETAFLPEPEPVPVPEATITTITSSTTTTTKTSDADIYGPDEPESNLYGPDEPEPRRTSNASLDGFGQQGRVVDLDGDGIADELDYFKFDEPAQMAKPTVVDLDL